MPHNPPQHINRLLLFKIGALGDVLLTTPLVRALRQRFPGAQINYLTGRWSAPALQNNPHISNLIEFDDQIISHRNVLKLLSLAAGIRRKKYDVIFVLDPGWQAGLLTSFFGSFRVGFDRGGEGKFHHLTISFQSTQHDSEQYLALGNLVGARSNNTSLELFRTTDDESVAGHLLKDSSRPCIALCPGGARNPYQDMPERRWPAAYYHELATKLEAVGFSVVILGNQADAGTARKVATQRSLNLAGRTNLHQAAAVVSKCRAAVTHDQGLLHVAATTHTPTISLFGPTDPRRKRPLGEQHRVIWHAAEPCEHNGKLKQCSPTHDMRSISVAKVLEAVITVQ